MSQPSRYIAQCGRIVVRITFAAFVATSLVFGPCLKDISAATPVAHVAAPSAGTVVAAQRFSRTATTLGDTVRLGVVAQRLVDAFQCDGAVDAVVTFDATSIRQSAHLGARGNDKAYFTGLEQGLASQRTRSLGARAGLTVTKTYPDLSVVSVHLTSIGAISRSPVTPRSPRSACRRRPGRSSCRACRSSARTSPTLRASAARARSSVSSTPG